MTRQPLIALELPSPAGTLAVLVSPEDGVVRAAGFTAPNILLGRLPMALRARGTVAAPAGPAGVVGGRPGAAAAGPAAAGALSRIADAVAAYSAGDLAALDAVTVEQDGGPFFQQVWRAMREIPAGTTISYAELAARAGNSGAVRAAGSACARNLLAPFLPCHRVLRSDGALGGYAYGLKVKDALLAHEERRP
jgi:methylated-DNA-[protein]-cysteine S-methyltransferase